LCTAPRFTLLVVGGVAFHQTQQRYIYKPAFAMATKAQKNKPPAPKYEWDFDVPDDPSWKDLEFTMARNFLTCYEPQELEKLHFDASLSVPDRLRFLLTERQSRLACREAMVAPAELHVAKPDEWRCMMLGIETMRKHLDLPKEEAQTIRTMLSTTEGNARIPWLNMLANLDLRNGDFVEAEALAREMLPWMQTHEKLGLDSPQASETTRTIIESIWKQGEAKEGEARRLIEETYALIDSMGGGKFEKYQGDERDLLGDLVSNLKVET
jgi:hypothetical protein